MKKEVFGVGPKDPSANTKKKKNELLMHMKKYSQDVSRRTYLFVQFIS